MSVIKTLIMVFDFCENFGDKVGFGNGADGFGTTIANRQHIRTNPLSPGVRYKINAAQSLAYG